MSSKIDFGAVRRYIETGEYPDGYIKTEKRNLRRKAQSYYLNDGLLFYKYTGSCGEARRVIERDAERLRILKACHEGLGTSKQASAMGGHFGRDKTLKRVTERYFWKGVKSDVTDFINKCDQCQKSNHVLKKPDPIPVIPNRVWSQVGVDLIGPLPQTSKGNKYVVTLSDYFSKWPEAQALPGKTAEAVANFLYKCICRHGVMEIQISDQGREFVNKVSEELHRLTRVEHRISIVYHPQTNGLDERFNQTLKRILEKCVELEDCHDDWDEFLDGILFAYRTARHNSTHVSPFFIMFNRKPRLPIELKFLSSIKDGEKYPDVEDCLEGLLQIRKQVQGKAVEHGNDMEAGSASDIVQEQCDQTSTASTTPRKSFGLLRRSRVKGTYSPSEYELGEQSRKKQRKEAHETQPTGTHGKDQCLDGSPLFATLALCGNVAEETIVQADDLLVRSSQADERERVFKHGLTMRDVARLRPNQLLNDKVMNTLLEVICRDTTRKGMSVACCSSFLLPKYRKDGYHRGDMITWFDKVNPLEKEWIIVPVHSSPEHWTIVVINTLKGELFFLDSLGDLCHEDVRDIKNIFCSLANDTDDDEVDPFEWRVYGSIEETAFPQQDGGHDCGVFAIMYALYKVNDVPYDFTQTDMPMIRRWLLAKLIEGIEEPPAESTRGAALTGDNLSRIPFIASGPPTSGGIEEKCYAKP